MEGRARANGAFFDSAPAFFRDLLNKRMANKITHNELVHDGIEYCWENRNESEQFRPPPQPPLGTPSYDSWAKIKEYVDRRNHTHIWYCWIYICYARHRGNEERAQAWMDEVKRLYGQKGLDTIAALEHEHVARECSFDCPACEYTNTIRKKSEQSSRELPPWMADD